MKTKNELIRTALLRGQIITKQWGVSRLETEKLSTRISEMRGYGWPITGKEKRNNSGVRYMEYYIAAKDMRFAKKLSVHKP